MWAIDATTGAGERPPRRDGSFFSAHCRRLVSNLLAAALYGVLFSHLQEQAFSTNWQMLFMIDAAPRCWSFTCASTSENRPQRLASQYSSDASTEARPRAASRRLGLTGRVPAPIPVHRAVDDGGSPRSRTARLGCCARRFTAGPQTQATPVMIWPDCRHRQPRALNWRQRLAAAFSEKFGRHRRIVRLRRTTLMIPMVPLWAWSHCR